jgi:hypothetical protein
LVILEIRFCATIITAAATKAIGPAAGRRRGSARVFHDALPNNAAKFETVQRPQRVPIAALEKSEHDELSVIEGEVIE